MSHEDDNAFTNNPIEESLNPSVNKEKKTNSKINLRFLTIVRQKSGHYLKVIKDI